MKLAIKKGKPWTKQLPVSLRKGAPYYLVMIYRDVHELRDAAIQFAGNLGGRRRRPAFWNNCNGACFYSGPPTKTGRCIGYILFCRECIGGGIVSHEMTHAAHFHLSRGTMNLKEKHAEPLATLNGHLVTLFWRWLYRRIGQ